MLGPKQNVLHDLKLPDTSLPFEWARFVYQMIVKYNFGTLGNSTVMSQKLLDTSIHHYVGES